MGNFNSSDIFNQSRFGEIVPPTFKCNLSHKSYTQLIHFSSRMEGIPENFLVNVVAFAFLLSIFCFIHKSAWNYGRLALLSRAAGSGEATETGSLLLDRELSLDQRPKDYTHFKTSEMKSQRLQPFLVKAFVLLKMSHVLKYSGKDAEQYLVFQQYIIVYLGVVCTVSLFIILPINLNGYYLIKGERLHFSHSTLANINPSSLVLFVHLFVSLFYFYVGLFLMIQFRHGLKQYPQKKANHCSVMIINVSIPQCNVKFFEELLKENYPNLVAKNIRIIYDSRKLILLNKLKNENAKAQNWVEGYSKQCGKKYMMHSSRLGRFFCCCFSEKCDALELYKAEEVEIAKNIKYATDFPTPLGIVLIELKTEEMARFLFENFHLSTNITPANKLNSILSPSKWKIAYVPHTEDIIWENVSVNWTFWHIRYMVINLFLIILFIFFTTPVIILNNLSLVNLDPKIIAKQVEKISILLSEFFPSLLLLIFTVTLPQIIVHTNTQMDHWSRASRNHSIMIYSYVYLLFMVLILPTLSLTSVSALRTLFLDPHQLYRWTCVFLPDNGAFFINYVITATFVGSGFDLLRLPDLFILGVRACLVRSRAELRNISRFVLNEFEFGIRYTWFLLVFTLVLSYSVICPLITPFGFLYMIFKHMVDRYNIFFVYSPSKINLNIHMTAMNFVVCSAIMAQLSLLSFFILRGGIASLSTVFSFLVILLSLSFQIRFNIQ